MARNSCDVCHKFARIHCCRFHFVIGTVRKKLDRFFSQSKPFYYKKGDILVRAGDPIFGIFFLKKGYVRQYVVSEKGDELTIHIYKPVCFFPIMLVFYGQQNLYYFEAMGDIEVWRAKPEKVVEFLKDEPDVLLDLTRRFAAGLVGLSTRIENLMFKDTYSRVASLLTYFAKRFGRREGKVIIIKLPLTHKDLAAWVGAPRENVSRQIEKLKKKALIITFDNHVIAVNDIRKLEEESLGR